MRVSAPNLQLQSDDGQWFNCESKYNTLEVQGCVSEKTIHLMAWGNDPIHFTLIAVAKKHYHDWLREHRDEYRKVMIIKANGMEPYIYKEMI